MTEQDQPKLEVLQRGVPHPSPDHPGTVDLLRLSDGEWHIKWASQAALYEAGDDQSEDAMARMVEIFYETKARASLSSPGPPEKENG